MKSLFVVVFSLMTVNLLAQERFDNFTFDQNVKSITVSVNGNIEHVPIMRLQSRDYMIINFDDLSNTEDEFLYRIVHCDRNWNPTEINELDYIDGYNDEVFRVWEYSELTDVQFTHYWVQFPNRDTRLKISGNYLFYVYRQEDDEEIPIFTRRFIISEDVALIGVEQVRSSISENDRFFQQFDITSTVTDDVQNPMRDVNVEVIQNGLWNNSISTAKPFNVNSNIVKFDPFGSIAFPGLVEFRSIDTRIKNGGGRGIQSVNINYDKSIAYLFTDLDWSRTPYINRFDFNGKYYIDARDALRNTTSLEAEKDMTSSDLRSSFSYENRLVDGEYTFLQKDIKSDYMELHFSLKSDHVEEDVYLYGAFTDWQLHPEFKMEYDFEEGKYNVAVDLKQGFYDYLYAVDGEDGIDLTRMQGTWFDTENEYTILTYFSEFATRYDRVLGARRFNSLYDR